MNNGDKPAPSAPVVTNYSMGPGDQYIVCHIPAGTGNLQVLTDGSKDDSEYALMLIAGLNVLLLQIHTKTQKEKSPILDPFAGIRARR